MILVATSAIRRILLHMWDMSILNLGLLLLLFLSAGRSSFGKKYRVACCSVSVLTPYLVRTTKMTHPAVLHDDVISTDFRM